MPNNPYKNVKMLIPTQVVLIDRYIKPIYGILDGFLEKFIVAGFATFLLQFLDLVGRTLVTDVHLVLSLLGLITFDFITGIWGAFKRGDKISSLGFRSTVVKVIEYSLLIIPFTILSNFNESLNWVQSWAYLIICLTEIKSISENVVWTKNVADVWVKFWKTLTEKNNINV